MPRFSLPVAFLASVLAGCSGAPVASPVATESALAPTASPVATVAPTGAAAPCEAAVNQRAAPTGPAIAAAIDLGCQAGGVAVGGGSVWVVPHLDRVALRIDPVTNTVRQVISLGNRGPGAEITATDDMVWASVSTPSFDYERLVRIDPATGSVVAEVKVKAGFPVIGAGFVWANGPGGVSRIDTATSTVAGTIGLRDCGVVILGEQVFCVGRGVSEIDPKTDESTSVPGAPGGFPVEADAGLIWGVGDDSMWAFDPRTGKVRAELAPPKGTNAWSLDALTLDGSLWATATTGEGAPDRLVRIDRSKMAIDCVLEIPVAEFGIGAGLGAIWVPVLRQPYVIRVEPVC